MIAIAEEIARLSREGAVFAVCTIVNTKGSTPRKIGAKMLVLSDGRIMGTIGGGELEKQVITDALKLLEGNEPQLFHYDLLHQLNMCCGGSVDIFIEPVMKKKRLYIFGAGHVGNALARFAAECEFDVFVIDERKELFAGLPAGIHQLPLDYKTALPSLPFDTDTFACIMTYSHPVDRDILAYCLGKPFAYLGMIGSRRKTEVTNKMFRDAGIDDAQLQRVDMPMGIDIGAEGPQEIAISILARLISVRNKSTEEKKQTHSRDLSHS